MVSNPEAQPATGPAPTADGIAPIAIKQVVVSCTFAFLAISAVCMRFWARKLKGIRPSTEDWLVVIGLVWTLGYAASNVLLVTDGAIGWSSEVIIAAGRLDRITAQLKIAVAGQVLYALALGFVKGSICVTLLRVFWLNKVFRVLGFIVLTLSIGWAIQTILIAFLICRPLSYNWDTTGVQGTCGDLHAAYLSVGIVDVVTDFLIFLMPIPMIQTLKMPTRSKIATSGVFALGLFTIACGAARTVSVSVVQFDPSDIETGVELTMWSIIEPCVGIIVACLIVMRPLIAHIGEKLSSLSSSLGLTSRKSTQQVSDGSAFGRTSPQRPMVGPPFVRLEAGNWSLPLQGYPMSGAESDCTEKKSGELSPEPELEHVCPTCGEQRSPIHMV